VLARLPAGSSIHYSWHTSDGAALLRAMRENRMEGVVAKRPGAIYSSGERSEAWLKIKTTGRQEFVVVGWRPPEYGPDDVRGLYLATHDNGQLVYRRSVGTGFTDRLRPQTLEVLKPIRSDLPLRVKGTLDSVEVVEVVEVPDPIWTAYEQDGDAEKLRKAHSNSLRAWSGPSLAACISHRPDSGAVVDRIYEIAAQRLASAPQPHTPYLAVLSLTKT